MSDVDPIRELVDALHADGKPPLAWVVRWSRGGVDPVAEAWAVSRDPVAMCDVLDRAGRVDARGLARALAEARETVEVRGRSRSVDGGEVVSRDAFTRGQNVYGPLPEMSLAAALEPVPRAAVRIERQSDTHSRTNVEISAFVEMTHSAASIVLREVIRADHVALDAALATSRANAIRRIRPPTLGQLMLAPRTR